MLRRLAIRYKWLTLPVLSLGLGLSWLGFAAQGQLFPAGGLFTPLIVHRSLSALRTIDALSYSLSAPIKELQVGGGLLVPSLSVRRLWLLAGRHWFIERWFWVCAIRWRICHRFASLVSSGQNRVGNLIDKLTSTIR